MMMCSSHDINRDSPITLENLSIGSSSPLQSGRTSPDEKSVCGSSFCDEGYCDNQTPFVERLHEIQCPVDAWQCENLHLLWQNHFHKLFDNCIHPWKLLGTFEDMPSPEFDRFQPLQCHEDIAKVRFYCPDCLRAWTSMRGKVIFWYGLDFQTGEGVVIFRLFGQQCKDCQSGFFEPAMWYPEEVIKVLNNVFEKARFQFYGNQMYNGPPRISTRRRHGKPKGYHNRDLCHACHVGLCRSKRR